MQLPCAWFEQIVETLDAPGAASLPVAGGGDTPASLPGDQRRREPRVGVRTRVTLIPLTDSDGLPSAPLAVPVRDLSAGGIGFLHTQKVGLDPQFVALLPQGRDSVAVLCQVAYYQPLAERLFAVGAKFVRVLRQPACEVDDAAPVLSLPVTRPAPRRVES